MFPFSSKPRPDFVTPRNFIEEKSLDTSAAEPRAIIQGSYINLMPDPVIKPIDAEKFAIVEDLVSRCPVAQRCVDIRADKLSSILVKVEGGALGKMLLESPNARDKTLAQNIYIWTNDLTLTGELWLMLDLSITGRPQLWRARPDLLKRDPKTRTVIYDDGRLTGANRERFRFTFDEAGDCLGCEERDGRNWHPYPAFLIRIAHHNPTSDIAGKGSCRSVLDSIHAWLELHKLIATNIKRGGPRHAATLKDTTHLSDADYATLQSRIQAAAASGSATPILPEAQLVAVGSTFSDLNAPEIKETLERDIATGLAIQPAMLGFKDQVEYAAQRGAERIFYKTWVKPEAEWLLGQLQANLRLYLGETNLTIELDEAHLSFTEDDRIERAEKYATIGVFSINEIRAELGFGPVPGGDAVAGASGTSSDTAVASRELDRALGTQSPAEREVDAVLSNREVSLNADTDNRRPVEPSDKPSN